MDSTRSSLPAPHGLDGLAQLAAYAAMTSPMEERESHVHGYDNSRNVPLSAGSEATDPAQEREPDYVREEPSTNQIRQASPPHVPGSTFSHFYDTLSPSQIKEEPAATPRADTPSVPALEQQLDGVADTESLRAIEELRKSELGLRVPSRENSTPSISTSEAPKPASGASKKRAAPKSATKKGTAKKPPAKKRKLEAGVNGVGGVRSGTPSKVTKAVPRGAKKSQSGTPAAGSPPGTYENASPTPDDESGSDSEVDDTVYCLCRGRDDHTWMIGCDGCEDWFHGRCVSLNKEEHDGLLAKFICPTCESEGKGHTTWKPMCRRDGCRKPARQGEAPGGNKYCSDECGISFFRNIVVASSKNLPAGPKKRTYTRRKANMTDNTTNSGLDSMADDIDPPPRGGVLRAKDIRALAESCNDVHEFFGLGSAVIPAPDTVKVDGTVMTSSAFPEDLLASLTPADSARLSKVTEQKTALQKRRNLLKDREQFIVLVREQHTSYAEKENMKPKDLCGFDSRLAWSDGEFQMWRDSRFGRAALAFGKLDPSEGDIASVSMEDASGNEATLINIEHGSALAADREAILDPNSPQLCTKKRCDRHKQWQKLHVQDLRFEDAETAEQARSLEREEKEIRERSLLRSRRVELGQGGTGRAREGWVETVA